MTPANITVRNGMSVELVNSMGDDDSVLRAMLISTLKDESVDTMAEEAKYGARIIYPVDVVDGEVTWREDAVDEGAEVKPSLRMTRSMADALRAALIKAPTTDQFILDTLKLEQQRVDKLLDLLIPPMTTLTPLRST